MKQAWTDLKSFVTILMTIAMVYVLIFSVEVNQAVFALFSTAYGSIITFFFTKKTSKEEKKESEEDTSSILGRDE